MIISLKNQRLKSFLMVLSFVLLPVLLHAQGTVIPSIGPIRVEFILFGLTLLGVAIFHKKTMIVALIGLSGVLIFKYIFDPEFNFFHHITGHDSFEGEWRILLNLMGLLLGFAILAKHFEESRVPEILPKYLPDDWKGGLVLLFFVFVMSAFLDNIAAAMIGGTIAMVVYRGKLHLGFLAAIIASSNAGGAGSVVGDTTTTLMWIDGVSPIWVLPAFIASFAAFLIFSVFGAIQQHKFAPILKDPPTGVRIDTGKLMIVVLILICAILTNYFLDFPALGVWIAILIGTLFRKTPWYEMGHAWKGTIFLISLVTIASLMPVEELPPASWQSAFSLGFISSVFDNIPLTKLCLDQGGYDWAVLAYAVGFGGSMIWFGSSAGVAMSNMYPQTRNTINYIKNGWYVVVAYVFGFFVMLGTVGWNPHEPHRDEHKTEMNKTHNVANPDSETLLTNE
jgi:Na+/H+ antiporter NhaD/arsenite permease-like protein